MCFKTGIQGFKINKKSCQHYADRDKIKHCIFHRLDLPTQNSKSVILYDKTTLESSS